MTSMLDLPAGHDVHDGPAHSDQPCAGANPGVSPHQALPQYLLSQWLAAGPSQRGRLDELVDATKFQWVVSYHQP